MPRRNVLDRRERILLAIVILCFVGIVGVCLSVL